MTNLIETQSDTLPSPEVGGVHLWHFSLDVPADLIPHYEMLLDEPERIRARRLIRTQHQERFIVGRARLRTLLGRYLSQPADAVTFAYSEQGKPSLVHPPLGGPFAFNLSHSGGSAVCAIGAFDTVGVDIEAIKESRDLLPIARRFFSEAERQQLMALPVEDQCRAFYQCWASKEALLKAWGTGLVTPLDKFTVLVAPGKGGVIQIDLPEWSSIPWRVYPVDVPSGFAAALATPGSLGALTVYNWLDLN